MKPSELGDILSKESWFLEQDPATARQKSWSPPSEDCVSDRRIGIGDRFAIQVYRGAGPVASHSHDFYELLYVTAGSLILFADQQKFHMGPGDAALIRAGISHYPVPKSEDTVAVILVLTRRLMNGQLWALLHELPVISCFLGNRNPQGLPCLFFPAQQDDLASCVMERVLCEHLDPDQRTYLMMEPLISMLLASLDRRCSSLEASQPLCHLSEIVDDVVRYINLNYATVTLQSTAARFGFSPNYLSQMLKRITGCGFRELRQQAAIEQSGLLLSNTELSVAEICNQIGFRNITHFYQLFERRYGVTPAQYRNNTGH